MPFSSPTMMIGADQNSENEDRLNLVILTISLHCIPTTVIFLRSSRWGHFDPIDNLSNQMADFEARKKYSNHL
jgi:hypothetical protein